jgi:soluble lytic murein transglycosylase
MVIASIVGALILVAPPSQAWAQSRPCTGRDCPTPAPKASAPSPARPAAPAATKPAAPAPARAAEPAGADEAFIAARTAAMRGDATRFEQVAPVVGASHPLAVYIDYWRLRLQLADARGEAATALDPVLRDFTTRHAGTQVGDLARRDWLMALGRRQDWGTFDTVLPGLVGRDDPAIRCLAVHSRAVGGESVMSEARELLMQPRELGDACNTLLASLVNLGWAGPADLWRRLEAALESAAPAAIRRAALAVSPGLDPKLLDDAIARPARTLESPVPRELTVIALASLARADPAEAAARLPDAGARLRPSDRAFLWSQVAAAGMRRLMPEAHGWTLQARTARPGDETLAWMTRAALRVRDWPTVRSTIERMSEPGRADPAWRYWYARALAADAARPESQHEARVILTALSGRADFYSQLAGEELGLRVSAPPAAEPPTEAELAEARANPALQRALKFIELGLRFDGNREWNFAMRGMDDRRLLAAADHARRIGLLDRSVAAADRTRSEHDYAMRFPTPFVERLRPIARAQGVDLAWVYGLIRQESRFVSDARSPVGASGLMQIMPGTARWIAGKMGARDFTPSRINELDTNLTFGTFYLKTVFDELDRSPVLASAAYNAGPGRPRSWRGTLPQPVEGAIFAEIIPFNETRGYVKHVLSKAAWYAALFTGEPQSLKALLGEVQPGPSAVATASPGGD